MKWEMLPGLRLPSGCPPRTCTPSEDLWEPRPFNGVGEDRCEYLVSGELVKFQRDGRWKDQTAVRAEKGNKRSYKWSQGVREYAHSVVNDL